MVDHHQPALQGMAQGVPRRAQRAGHCRAPHRTLRALRPREGIPHPQPQALITALTRADTISATPALPPRRQVDEHRWTFGTGPFAQRKVVPWSPLKPLALVPAVTAGNNLHLRRLLPLVVNIRRSGGMANSWEARRCGRASLPCSRRAGSCRRPVWRSRRTGMAERYAAVVSGNHRWYQHD
jgi:hypothetical protein